MRILILNWRDIKNPGSGGAEILTHEMAKKWLAWGHTVIQISARFNQAKKEEIIDGVKIIRLGRWWSVHFLASIYYLKYLRNKTDVIIDEVHGLPFFAAIYAPHKTILFACEVADKLFFHVFPAPVARIGIALEKIYFKLYRNVPVLAISSSTQKDLINRGFRKRNITVLPMGLNVPENLKKYSKEKNPTIIYLSRINKQKGIEDAIEAFRLIHDSIPNSRLWIVGTGAPQYVGRIKNIIKNYGVSKYVKFFGFVNEKEKFELLSRSHILIFPSVHEGWGLVIAEAGSVGTPSVVYDVPGVRDVVSRGKRGIMVKRGRPDLIAKEVTQILKNDTLYKSLINNLTAFKNAAGWDKTSRTAILVLKKYANQKN